MSNLPVTPSPNKSVSKEILDGLYNPTWDAQQFDLNNFLSDPEEKQKEVAASLRNKIRDYSIPEPKVGVDGIPIPLTEEEAREVDEAIEDLRARIANQKGEIADLREYIDSTAKPKDGQEMSFELNIRRKPALKKAVRKVYGVSSKTITYSMYKEAVELKRKLEREQSNEYTNADRAKDVKKKGRK